MLHTIIDFGKLAEESVCMDNSNERKVTEDLSNFSVMMQNKIPDAEIDEQPSCPESPQNSAQTIGINNI